MPFVNVAAPRRRMLPPGYMARRRAAFARANALARPLPLLAEGRGLGTAFVTGIPDSPTCGPNPCGFTDILGPSQQCINFVQCADPAEFSSWLAGKGSLVPSLAAQAGTDVSGTVNTFVDSLFGGGAPNPAGSGINWTLIAIVAGGLLFLPRLVRG